MNQETKAWQKDIKERVDRGVAVLDKHIPEWWKRIDLKEFEISVPCQCVLGQIQSSEAEYDNRYQAYDDISARLEQAEIDYGAGESSVGWLSNHGFDIRSNEDSFAYVYLERLWTKVIRKRKGLKRG